MKLLSNDPNAAPGRGAYALAFAALAALMIATRVHHFGTALHLPDASMAVFFLAGMILQRGSRGLGPLLPFLALVALAGVVDWASITYAGVSDFCVTVAYSFLLPAYAVLWYAGQLARRFDWSVRGVVGRSALALAGASGSFLVSNGAFYWLGGRYADPHMAQYLERLWQWGPLFVRTTMAYVLMALVLHALAIAFTRTAAARRTAGT